MEISFYDFQNLHNEEFRKEIKEIIGEIIDNNAFAEGEYNHKFEKDFAKMQGANYCALVGNGTDAIEISLEVLGIGHGDKVGVPGITFYATIEAILNRGATPVYIDINPEDGLICPESTKRMVEAHDLKAIIPVHIYGLPAPIAELEAVCNPKGVKIIEDSAQAQGTFLPSGPVGSTNNMSTFSFYPTKNLAAFGDAGAVLVPSEELYKKIKTIGNHGRGDDAMYGRNSRCDHIQAAVLYKKLEKIEEYNKSRKEVATLYHQNLEGSKVKTLPTKYLQTSSWHLYPVQCESAEVRESLANLLSEKGVSTTPFYAEALSEMTPFKGHEGEDEKAKAFAGRTLCLPISAFTTKEQIEYICNIIKSV
ncbi:putative DegT family aminotransferase [Halobacteriovorax marinus SJ]|uniref:DegT family aminotransferase n=1 Tax=Halobacteriovorax marinus (strain ATCC BAA-682 / DSM 15412 / SJ) TaxID=862908 RepID=E1X3Y8_HALMS|nr:DegT/DnrJ/EryC1/StrS family aminotransferase [Halobacteriovorax marinus]CBW25328.1 putative DegT family aminotransferase [Halobacteriovorax marinus SJ]